FWMRLPSPRITEAFPQSPDSSKSLEGAPSLSRTLRKGGVLTFRSSQAAGPPDLARNSNFWFERCLHCLQIASANATIAREFELYRESSNCTARVQTVPRVQNVHRKDRPWIPPPHSSTRKSWNLATGAARRLRKCAKSSGTQTPTSSKSGSGSSRNPAARPFSPTEASS